MKILILLAAFTGPAQAQNLLLNPSCEVGGNQNELMKGWALQGTHQNCKVAVVLEGARSGKHALHAVAGPAATRGRFCVDVKLSRKEANPGEIYTLSAWYRTTGRASISIVAAFAGQSGFNPQSGESIRSTGVEGNPSKDWNLAQTTVILPEGTERFSSVRVYGYMNAPGEEVWIDDLRLEPSHALTVPPIEKPPKIDGNLSEDVWKRAPSFRFFTLDRQEPPRQPTTGFILRDAANLYIGFKCDEPSLDDVHFEDAKRDASQVWKFDRMEMFLALKEKQGHLVHQFVTNLAGSRYDERNAKNSWNPDWEVMTSRGEKEWFIEARIPITALGYKTWPEFEQIRFNAIRGRKLKNTPHSFSAWSPPGKVFKAPEKMGLLIIGDPLEYMRRLGLLKLKVHTNRLTYTKHDRNLVGWVEVPVWNAAVQKYRFKLEILDGDRVAKSRPLKQKPVGFRIEENIRDLKAGNYELRIDVRNEKGEQTGSGTRTFFVDETYQEPKDEEKRVALRMTKPSPVSLESWNFVTGIPMPRGLMNSPANARLMDADGKEVSSSMKSLGRWAPYKDSSVRWLRIDFNDAVTKDKANQYTLHIGGKHSLPSGILVTNKDDRIEVDAGRLSFAVRKNGFNFLDGLTVDRNPVIPVGHNQSPYIVDHNGILHSAMLDPNTKVEVEYTSRHRVVIRASGSHLSNEGRPLSRFIVRMTALWGLPYLHVSHTFIITEDTNKVCYRDIALPIPITGEAICGDEDGKQIAIKPGANLLQRTWENYQVQSNTGTELSAGKKASGWLVRGKMGLAVQDFWQNYPKEIEVKDDSNLIVHFWPAHGVDNPNRKITLSDFAYLWFCHEGRELNFSIGPKYRTKEFVERAYSKNCYTVAMKSNAAGIAKTHDMMLVFDPEKVAPEKMRDYNAMFQSDPHVLAAPEWNCSTEAFGRMHPYDEKRFKPIEDFVSRSFDAFKRVRDHHNDYGMWSWGDTHTGYMRRNFNIYRQNKNTHQGRPREYLYHYFRTGDPKYIDWARRNHRHVADVDTVHVTIDQPGLTKYTGGVCYPGVTHWIGDGYFGFYTMQDFMWNLHLLTGDRRMLDVIHEQENYLRNHRGGTDGRSGAGALASTLKFYMQTQDVGLLPSIYAQRETMMKRPGHKQHAAAWGPWLRRLIEEFGDKEAVKFAKAWAGSGKLDIFGIPAGPDVIGHAALSAGNDEFLRRPRGKLELLTATQFLNPEKLYHGDNGFHDYYRYFAQEFPYLLAAFAKFPPKGAPIFDPPGFGVIDGNIAGRREFNLFLKPGKQQDKPITMTWRAGGHADFNLVVTSSKGQKVYQRTLKTSDADAVPSHRLPPLKSGHYHLRVDGPYKNFLYRYLILSPDDTKFVVQSNEQMGIYLALGRWFFTPKPDAKTMTFHLFQRWGFHDRFTTAGVIYDPDGNRAARFDLAQYQSLKLDMPVKPEHRNKLFKMYTRGVTIRKVEGVEPYFSPAPDTFFIPGK
jgi:hypothetical protein